MQGQGEWRQRIIGRQSVATRDPQLGDNRDPYFAQSLNITLNRALGHLKTLGDLPGGAFSSLEEQKNRCQAVHTVHLLSSNGSAHRLRNEIPHEEKTSNVATACSPDLCSKCHVCREAAIWYTLLK